MGYLRILFLFTVLLATSGYKFRCHWFCIDHTAIQQDYVEERERCLELAQLKVDTSSAPLDDAGRKALYNSTVTECMVQNGQPVGDAKAAAPAAAAAAGAAGAAGAVTAAAPLPPNPVEEKAAISRTSECDFARQAADVSSISAARAKACDLECEQALKAAPEAPRPAACPAAFKDSLAKGTEKQ